MLVITGGSILTNNTAQYGGEFHAIASKMYFSGNHSFKEKQGQFGGGCLLSDSSLVYCSSEEYTNTVRFVSNYAHQYGGAVWVKDIPFCSCYCSAGDRLKYPVIYHRLSTLHGRLCNCTGIQTCKSPHPHPEKLPDCGWTQQIQQTRHLLHWTIALHHLSCIIWWAPVAVN